MTTRTLYVLRHAAAEPTAEGGDTNRPLAPEGREQVERVAEALRGLTPSVQRILCSAAMRTRQTAELLQLGCPIEYSDLLYHAGSTGIAREIGELIDDDVTSLLVVGHAPGVPALAHALADPAASDADALESIDSHYPTATLCRIELDGSWADLAGGGQRGRLTDVVTSI